MLVIETSPRFQPEKEYCFRVLFGELLELDYRVVYTPEAKNYLLRLPNGAVIRIEDDFFARFPEDETATSAYLQPQYAIPGTSIFTSPFDPSELIVCIYGKPDIRIDNEGITCGVDLFASSFFMLARWEEYVLPDRDRHGRFPAEKSLAFRKEFLSRPVVNEYAALLATMFARLSWEPPKPRRRFKMTVSCDVDHPRLWWTVADRIRTLGGCIFRRGDLPEAGFWLRKHIFQKKDPYDVFDDWLDFYEKNGLVGHFNFLGKRPASSNCWYPLEHPFVVNLIHKIAGRGHVIGFHPSYEAFENPQFFREELSSLRAVSPAPVTTGRQHYLRFAAPRTWQMWDDAGMDWDSTAGYPDMEGFRCGICNDFPVFNFLTRKTLRLREKPLIAMDATLAQYRNYSRETAFGHLQQLRSEAKKHAGEFVLLWHNSSWNTYFWAPWQEAYLDFISQ